jgi:hypothetical protein
VVSKFDFMGRSKMYSRFGLLIVAALLVSCNQSKKQVKPSTEDSSSIADTGSASAVANEQVQNDDESKTISSSSTDFSLLDYVKWPDEEDGTYRTFAHYKDDQEALLFLMQEVNSMEDTVYQMTYTWLRGDSVPMNRSVERYSKNNWLEFVGQAFFEPAPNGEIREIKAQLDGKSKFAYDDPELSATVFYAFYNDPSATMDFISSMKYTLERIPALDPVNDCLVLSSDEVAKMYFKDERENTEQNSFSRLTYVKNKGLVRIFQSNEDSEIEYNIVE